MLTECTIRVDEEQLNFIKDAIMDLYRSGESIIFSRRNSGKKFDDVENDVNVYGSILSEINYSYNKGKEELVKCAIANDQMIDEMNKKDKMLKKEIKNFDEILGYYTSIIDECAEVSRTYLEPPVGTHGMKKEDLKNFLEYRTGLALDVIKNSA